MKMKQFKLTVMFLIGSIFFLVSTASAVIMVDPFWQIDEIVDEIIENEGSLFDVYFHINNQHETQAISGFGVGIPNDVTNIYWSGPQPITSDWARDIVYQSGWNTVGNYNWTNPETNWLDPTLSLQAFFGGISWEEAFGNDYDRAYVAWDHYDKPGAPQSPTLGAGTSYIGNLFIYQYSDGVPMSPAIVALGNGSAFTGETGVQNLFPNNGSTVPEPATMLLFALGLLGFTGVSRRKQ